MRKCRICLVRRFCGFELVGGEEEEGEGGRVGCYLEDFKGV